MILDVCVPIFQRSAIIDIPDHIPSLYHQNCNEIS